MGFIIAVLAISTLFQIYVLSLAVIHALVDERNPWALVQLLDC